MKKLIAAGVVLAGVMGGASAKADSISAVEAYAGGWEMWTAGGGFCQVGVNDSTSNLMFSTALSGLANPWGVYVYAAGQVGWGYGYYGGGNCALVQVYHQ